MAEPRKRGRPPGNCRTAAVGNEQDPRDVEIERLQQRIQELELQQEDTGSEQTWEDDENPFSYVQGQRGFRGDNRADPLRSIGMKVEIPEFAGKAHLDDFIEWLSTVERVFDLRDIPESLKVKVVATRLRQHASLWWDHVKKQRVLAGKSKVQTWEKMKKLLKEKFLPINHRQEAFLDYHNLSQGSLSVEETINEFDKLRMRCDANEEEEQVVARFLRVLKSEIADVVSLQPYLTYSDVCRLALKVEKQQSKGKGKSSFSRFTPIAKTTPITVKGTTPSSSAPTNNSGGNKIQAPRCYKCQGGKTQPPSVCSGSGGSE
ncbi:reverse transcriptase domain-containing protein [Artemisia annua]|uniref:Reverse transcriptase domain-containing protein n=1 Tax=Artemisia annua TaxID=35608 RepID=A0A2U1MAR7_ARTAN|nr:reverse transcriptase domain-containing protein [Artemisia annua]